MVALYPTLAPELPLQAMVPQHILFIICTQVAQPIEEYHNTVTRQPFLILILLLNLLCILSLQFIDDLACFLVIAEVNINFIKLYLGLPGVFEGRWTFDLDGFTNGYLIIDVAAFFGREAVPVVGVPTNVSPLLVIHLAMLASHGSLVKDVAGVDALIHVLQALHDAVGQCALIHIVLLV